MPTLFIRSILRIVLIGQAAFGAMLVYALPPARSPLPATLLRFDFNNTASSAWPQASAFASSASLHATATQKQVGTVDVANSIAPSGALLLSVAPPGGSTIGAWSAALLSGLLPVMNTESNLGKLTLSFSLSASAAEPIRVSVASFDAAGIAPAV